MLGRLFKKSRNKPSVQSGSRYGIKMDAPPLPRSMKLCMHLGVSENTRKKLQKLIVDNWTLRPESLVAEFLNIMSVHQLEPKFPSEIIRIVEGRYKRNPKPDVVTKEAAAIYIRHEMNRWKMHAELQRAKALGVKRVRIRTSEDQRVCQTCRSMDRQIYPIHKVPRLPGCWDCRCYYEPIIE